MREEESVTGSSEKWDFFRTYFCLLLPCTFLMSKK